MRYLFIFALITGLTSFSSECVQNVYSAEKQFTAKIIAVHDGDTVTARAISNGNVYKVRLLEIDAPEVNPRQDWGKEATVALKELILNQRVIIKWSEQDHYKRTLGHIYLPDYKVEGQPYDINRYMVLTGNAWVYREYPHDKELESLEDTARLSMVGLWSMPGPIYPSIFRKDHKNGVEK